MRELIASISITTRTSLTDLEAIPIAELLEWRDVLNELLTRAEQEVDDHGVGRR